LHAIFYSPVAYIVEYEVVFGSKFHITSSYSWLYYSYV